MVSARASLRRELRNAGLTRQAIDAVWPEWWSEDAEQSLSATTELKYTVARRLGISPRSLFEGPPRFVWRDEAKFKNLGASTETERFILTSFGVAMGRSLINATPSSRNLVDVSPAELREAALANWPNVGLEELLTICWSVGVPVIKTTIFPLSQKRMQAMTVRSGDRYAILIGRDTRFPAWIAFVLAHEIGHIARGHISENAALLEMSDPLQVTDRDAEELAADRFALALLTGDAELSVTADADNYTARQVAHAVLTAAPEMGINPGVLALCLAYSSGRWRQSIGALKIIPGQELEEDVGIVVNRFARGQLDWTRLPSERVNYLRTIMGRVDGD